MELFHLMLLLIPIMYVLALCVGLYIAICPMKTSVTPRGRRNRAIPDCVRLIYWLRCNRTALRELVAILCLGVILGYFAVEGFMPDERYVVEVRR